MILSLRSTIVFLLIVAACHSATPCRAARPDTVDVPSAVSAIAQPIADIVKPLNFHEIVVGSFEDEFDLNRTGGVSIQKLLIAELEKREVHAVRSGEVRIKGRYAEFTGQTELTAADVTRSIPVARIAFQVVRKNGQVLLDSEKLVERDRLKFVVTNPGDVVALLGPNGTIQPPDAKDDISDRDRRLRDSVDNDKVAGNIQIVGTRIVPKGSPYALEVLVARQVGDKAPAKESYQPRGVELRDGLPFIKLEPGEVYAIRLYNLAKHDLGARVTIDGLSMFAFRDEKADSNQSVILPPNSFGEVLGWYRTAQKSDTFLVRDYASGRAGELLKNLSEVGSITVAFHAAWEKDRPGDEPAFDSRSGSVETTGGAPIDAPYKTVNRSIGVLRAALTVRYDKR